MVVNELFDDYEIYIKELDNPIELEELMSALNKCKKNKSPGEYELAYEFFKALPQNWLLYIVFYLTR